MRSLWLWILALAVVGCKQVACPPPSREGLCIVLEYHGTVPHLERCKYREAMWTCTDRSICVRDSVPAEDPAAVKP